MANQNLSDLNGYLFEQLERLNQEIRRRERVIRIFPNVQSAERLIGSMLIDIDEEWQTCNKRYIEYTHLETTE